MNTYNYKYYFLSENTTKVDAVKTSLKWYDFLLSPRLKLTADSDFYAFYGDSEMNIN